MIVHTLCDVVDPQASPVRATRATPPLCELSTEVSIYVCSTLSLTPVRQVGALTKSRVTQPTLPLCEFL